jgi:hypothetical protein
LYCPAPLVYHPEFTTIVGLAVEVITIHCQQERDSTRATLHWLSHLFGWHVVRLSPSTGQVLESAKDRLTQLLLMQPPNTTMMTTAATLSLSSTAGLMWPSSCYGSQLTNACIVGLIGGGPQMLWASYADCLYAIVANLMIEPTLNSGNSEVAKNGVSTNNNNHTDRSPMVYQWLYTSMMSTLYAPATDPSLSSTIPQSVLVNPDGLCQQVCTIFMTMIKQQGTKSRPKAKMLLTDFAKIVSGEMAHNALVSYALPVY